MYTQLKKEVRKFIYDQFYNNSVPPTLEEIMFQFNVKRIDIISVLESLHDDHLVVIDKKINKIMIANPFAGIPTSFSVKSNSGKSYFATCAWDSIAMHITFEEDIEISSFCYFCNNQIKLFLKDEKIQSKTPNDVLIHFQYPARDWWVDIIDTCYNTMNFFCSNQHLNDHQVMDLSILLYKNKMELDYERPTLDEIRDRFEKNELKGDFWQI